MATCCFAWSEYCKGHQDHVKANSKFPRIIFQVDPYIPNKILSRETALTKMEMGTGICIIVDWLKRGRVLVFGDSSYNR